MIAKGTPPWIFYFPALSLVILFLSIVFGDLRVLLFIIGVVPLVLFLPVLSFFRDPSRKVGGGIVSPADGKVMFVEPSTDKGSTQIAIFMSPLNVHVNRAPLAGRVMKVKHVEGGFKVAFDKDSEYNERVIIDLHTKIGAVRVVQIAGALARRIIPYVDEGTRLRKGERMGMIRFGSRVDVYLPSKLVEPAVTPGQKILAGSDTIANIR